MEQRVRVNDLLLEWGVGFEEVEPGTFVINEPSRGWFGLVVSQVDDIIVVRLDVMELPQDPTLRNRLLEEVLRKNADGISFGAYALSGERLVLVNSLLAPTMDPEELQASLDSLSLALVEHYPILAQYWTPAPA